MPGEIDPQVRSQQRRGTRSAQATMARAVGTEILRGDHAVGATLPNEADLMARFGVSRTVVREVIKTLAAKGMVASRTKVGTRVLETERWNMFDAEVLAWRVDLGLDEAFLTSLFEIRLAIEPYGAALAAARRSAADIVRLRDLSRQMALPGHSAESFAEVDLAFHLAISDATGNPFMRSIGAVIETALMHSFAMTSPVQDPDRLRYTAHEHALIVDRLEAQDPQGASEAMLSVIREGMRSRLMSYN